MSRDCEHGNLARKCPICELIAAEARIAELESKLEACRKVVQQIARSDYIDESWQDWRAGDGYISELMAILDTPKEPK